MSASNSQPAAQPSNDESLDWMRQIQTQQRKCDEENGVLRNLWKRAKAAGENIKSMRETIADSRLDPTVAVANMRDKTRYMVLRKMPVTQEALFSWEEHVTEKTAAAEDIWEVEETGYKAGRAGAKIDDNPHLQGTEFFVVWRAWWEKGQAAIARELGPDARQASAARERPVREGPAQTELPGTKRANVTPIGAVGRSGRKKAARKAPAKHPGQQARRHGQRTLPAPGTTPLN